MYLLSRNPISATDSQHDHEHQRLIVVRSRKKAVASATRMSRRSSARIPMKRAREAVHRNRRHPSFSRQRDENVSDWVAAVNVLHRSPTRFSRFDDAGSGRPP